MDRENVIRHIREEIENAKFQKTHYASVSIDILSDACELLKKQKARKFFADESGKVNPLPVVVRCKDCRFFTEPDSHGDQCAKIHWSRGAEWFCADGERRDNEAKRNE